MLLDNNLIPSGGQKSKKEIAQQLMCGKIFKMEAFTGPTHANNDGAVDHSGSHSIRKFAPKHSQLLQIHQRQQARISMVLDGSLKKRMFQMSTRIKNCCTQMLKLLETVCWWPLLFFSYFLRRAD
jgi:hypothetical protein